MSQQSDVVIVGAPEHPDEGEIVCSTVGSAGIVILVAPQRSKMTMSLLSRARNWGIDIDNAGWLQFGNMGQGVTYKVTGAHEENGNTILDLERIV